MNYIISSWHTCFQLSKCSVLAAIHIILKITCPTRIVVPSLQKTDAFDTNIILPIKFENCSLILFITSLQSNLHDNNMYIYCFKKEEAICMFYRVKHTHLPLVQGTTGDDMLNNARFLGAFFYLVRLNLSPMLKTC